MRRAQQPAACDSHFANGGRHEENVPKAIILRAECLREAQF